MQYKVASFLTNPKKSNQVHKTLNMSNQSVVVECLTPASRPKNFS